LSPDDLGAGGSAAGGGGSAATLDFAGGFAGVVSALGVSGAGSTTMTVSFTELAAEADESPFSISGFSRESVAEFFAPEFAEADSGEGCTEPRPTTIPRTKKIEHKITMPIKTINVKL
jgi:hypothetical protein